VRKLEVHFLPGAELPAVPPTPLRRLNLLPVLIGDSASGKPESPYTKLKRRRR
jgi:hypothetical protein